MNILSFFSTKREKASKTHIKNLVELANVDGHFDSRENDFLKKLGRRENISQRFIRKIAKETGNLEVQIPDDTETRFKQFYDLVAMMLADNFIHDTEKKFIKHWGEKFGYKKKHLDELIDSIAQNIHHGHDVASTKDRVKWML